MKNLKLNNLRKELLKDITKNLKDSREALKEKNTIEGVKEYHFLRQYLTPSTKNKNWANVEEMKTYILKRIAKAEEKRKEEAIQNFETVLNAGDLKECTITVIWAKSRTWGANPKAEANFCYYEKDSKYLRYETVCSSSIGGCGYDKLSTAIAEAINQINPILKALYKEKNKTKNVKLRNYDIFGYGSGYGILPRFEGGVGVNCYPDIFKAIGYKFETVTSGKNFDVYKITKQ